MLKPLISVVIPAYNEEELIENCLKSILNQNFPKNDYEVILIDNNSTDRTAAIAKNLGVKVVKEEKQGLVYARMKGVQEAKTDIVAFNDADTVVSPNWLQTIWDIYQKDPQIVGIGFLGELLPKKILVRLTQPPVQLVAKVFKIMNGYSFSFKKSAYLKCGGYSSSVDFGEDFHISKKLKKVGRIVIVYKKGLVTTASRRFKNLKTILSYGSKMFISFLSVFLLNISFFKLKPVKKSPE